MDYEKAIKRKIKKYFKKGLKRIHKVMNPPIKYFDKKTLPWIDFENVDIDHFLKIHPELNNIGFDIKEKLLFWEMNGYVIFENVIPNKAIDAFLEGFEKLIENREKFLTEVFIEVPEYDETRIQHAKNVSESLIKGAYVKHLELHNPIKAGKNLMLNEKIVDFLKIIFQDSIVGMQSLTFRYGSQQPAHQDFAFVKPGVPSHLAASWIALEDVNQNAGPLFYYEGSHKIKKFNFGNGILHMHKDSVRSTDEFSNYLVQECKRLKLKRKELLLKKGDVLLWHSALVHGGTAIKEQGLTRKSFVCHYTTKKTYLKNLPVNLKDNKFEIINGGYVYHHPKFQNDENHYN